MPKPQVTTPTVTISKPKPPAVTTSASAGSTGAAASVGAVSDDGAVLTLDDGSVYSVDAGDQSTVSSWSSGDSVTVDNGQDAIFNTSTGESVSVSSVGDSSDSNPYSGTGSSIQAKSDDGSIIVLDDGSIWIVDSADQATSGPWVDATSITVSQKPDGSYDLVDTDDQESVAASYIGQE